MVPYAEITSGIFSYMQQNLWDLWNQALVLLSQIEQLFRKTPKEKTKRFPSSQTSFEEEVSWALISWGNLHGNSYIKGVRHGQLE